MATTGVNGGVSTSAARLYTLREVERAFALHGMRLERAIRTRLKGRPVILLDPSRTAAYGYEFGFKSHWPGGTQYIVFIGDGPHSARRGNVFVTFGDGQRSTVEAALKQLR
jgi:hypothetical protein